jgi:HPt (histidine-containing phosphotransfer) domain-containing protein
LVRIVRLFLEQLDPQAEQIEQDHRSGDLATLARNAHRMKSSAATLGALEMAELLVAIEETARAQDAAACDPLVARFAAAVGATREAFQVILEELEVEVDGES